MTSDYPSLLRSMLSPSWQKPSERKIADLLKKIEDDEGTASDNRHRLTALVTAGTKLDIASRLIREATTSIASSGLRPAVCEEAQQIATIIDEYIQRRILSTIDHIP